MKLRFSLRLVFLVFALLAAALYWYFARPTILANRFAAAVQQCDFETVNDLLRDGNLRIHSSDGNLSNGDRPIDRVYVEVLPRDWGDWLAGRRRLIFRFSCHTDEDGRHVEWTEDADVVASTNGLNVIPFEIKFPAGGINFQLPPEQAGRVDYFRNSDQTLVP